MSMRVNCHICFLFCSTIFVRFSLGLSVKLSSYLLVAFGERAFSKINLRGIVANGGLWIAISYTQIAV